MNDKEPICQHCAVVLSNIYKSQGGSIAFYPQVDVQECSRCGNMLPMDEVSWFPAVIVPIRSPP